VTQDQIQRWYAYFVHLIQRYDEILITYLRLVHIIDSHLTSREKTALNSTGAIRTRGGAQSFHRIEADNRRDESDSEVVSGNEDETETQRNCQYPA
jgi:hypothetical protein